MKIFDPNYWEEASAIKLETQIAKVYSVFLFSPFMIKLAKKKPSL